MINIPVIAIPATDFSKGMPLCEACAHDALITDYSDTYKGYNGIRPTWRYAELDAMSNDEIYAEINEMIDREVEYELADAKAKAEAKAEETRIAVEGIGPKLDSAIATALKELTA